MTARAGRLLVVRRELLGGDASRRCRAPRRTSRASGRRSAARPVSAPRRATRRAGSPGRGARGSGMASVYLGSSVETGPQRGPWRARARARLHYDSCPEPLRGTAHMKNGYIDIVCNVFTPEAVRKGQTGIDEAFKAQVRMAPEMRGRRHDVRITSARWTGRHRALAADRGARGDLSVKRLVRDALRAGREDLRASTRTGSPGLAGIDPTRGMQGLRTWTTAVEGATASSARTGIRTGSACRPTTRRSTRTTPSAASSTSRS